MLYRRYDSLREQYTKNFLLVVRKPNSIIVLLFLQNISKFLISSPPLSDSSNLSPISQNGFKI